MLLATAVYPAQLLLVGPLLLTWLTRLAPWSRSSPRQLSDAYYPSVLTSINYGLAYPVPLLVFTMGITYAPVAPLILPFCAVFFGLAHFIYKYLLLYVNIPRYETGGLHAPMAVKRCLMGMMVMQLAMMGVLAAKAGSSSEHGGSGLEDDGKFKWTGYVKMVAGISPLLVITWIIHWWLKHGYEQEVQNIPLDIIGSVARDLEKRGNGRNGGGIRRGLVDDTFDEVDAGKELKSVARKLSKRSSLRAPFLKGKRASGASGLSRDGGDGISDAGGSSTEGTRDDGDGVPVPKRFSFQREGIAVSMSPPAQSSVERSGSRLSRTTDDATSPNSMVFEDTFPEDDDALLAFTEGDSLLPTTTTSPLTTPLFDDDEDSSTAPTPHLEPPMTHVSGVLDAPFVTATSIVPEGDEGDRAFRAAYSNNAPSSGSDEEDEDMDLQLYTYVHPALIGRLPVAWVPGAVQPKRCVEAREEQSKIQRELYRRIVGRQRVGVRAATEDDDGGDDNGVDERWGIGSSGSMSVRARRNRLSKVRSFVDGITSWAHLSMT